MCTGPGAWAARTITRGKGEKIMKPAGGVVLGVHQITEFCVLWVSKRRNRFARVIFSEYLIADKPKYPYFVRLRAWGSRDCL